MQRFIQKWGELFDLVNAVIAHGRFGGVIVCSGVRVLHAEIPLGKTICPSDAHLSQSELLAKTLARGLASLGFSVRLIDCGSAVSSLGAEVESRGRERWS